ncbi:NADH-dependent reduced ferredoxin:NADP+ oxidoreductase [Acidobacteriia bacterium SbA2]|nr:NADH-dependent reduced ferredoxin:NADP+ oxidoreductase [Acidobacteriia bacterium SbA2]
MSTLNTTTVGTPAPDTRPKVKPNPKAPRQPLPLLTPEERLRGPAEVALGFTLAQVQVEALRCLQCKNATCVDACPLHINVKGFIGLMSVGDFASAFDKISEESPFPGICGRVCQHELYCERACLLGKKLDPVAIGSLERFAADYHRRTAAGPPPAPPHGGPRVALVGSGPASLIAAYDLIRHGYRVTVFEALHGLGGVLAYGIPNFRLPREIIRDEVNRLRSMGVEFRTDFIVGKTEAVDELFAEGFEAIFLGTGAGLPHLMNIPGENLIGVYTANEYLTRLNLMEAFRFPESDTPIRIGKRVVVVGGGNSAMDAARWSRRMGSDTTIMFRRGRAELRARLEEIEHAEEEGVHFEFLAAPVRLFGDEKGILHEMECIRMQLGEVDESGRPSPVPMPGSEYRMEVDTVVMAIGQSPNPTVQRATPQLLTKRGKVVIDSSGMTSMPNVFAGGDVVRGGSTVILAMRDGRAAAAAIHNALNYQPPEAQPLLAVPLVQTESAAHAEAPVTPDTTQAGVSVPPETAQAGVPVLPEGNLVLAKRLLTPEIAWFEVEAPEIARRWKPGQFIIIRPTKTSERIPLTIVDGDQAKGSITLVVQALGKTSRTTVQLEAGDRLADLLGPLGEPASIENVGNVLCLAGGVGVAELLPVARAFRKAGNHVTALCGARSSSLIILDAELRAAADEVYWATDDGTAGVHGTVVDLMRVWRKGNDGELGLAHVIGPIPMMRAAAEVTREWGVHTYASLNPIMVDGTGMCGGCRVTVGGKVRFACVDGPEFDAHQVDFDELTRRTRAYLAEERVARERHDCSVGLGQ